MNGKKARQLAYLICLQQLLINHTSHTIFTVVFFLFFFAYSRHTTEYKFVCTRAVYSDHHHACCLIFRSRIDFIFLSFAHTYKSISNTRSSMVFSWAVKTHRRKCMCERTMDGPLPSSIHARTLFNIFFLLLSLSMWIYIYMCARWTHSTRDRKRSAPWPSWLLSFYVVVVDDDDERMMARVVAK
jgi:hypothetical protein